MSFFAEIFWQMRTSRNGATKRAQECPRFVFILEFFVKADPDAAGTQRMENINRILPGFRKHLNVRPRSRILR